MSAKYDQPDDTDLDEAADFSAVTLTAAQEEACCKVSTAAAEDSALAYCLRLGQQQKRSALLQSSCDEALTVIKTSPGTNSGNDAEFWDALLVVSRSLHDALLGAATLVISFSIRSVVSKRSTNRLIELESLFWRFTTQHLKFFGR